MLKAVFRVEWRSALRDGALRAVFAVFAVLMAYAAFGGSRFVDAERTSMEAALRDEAAKHEQLRSELVAIAGGAQVKNAADPRSPLQVGRELSPRVAALPPGPLAVVAVGQRDVLPQIVELTTKTRLDSAEHDDGASPLRQSNGPFDLAFVLVFLLPLIIIALSYDVLSGERERGTLALVLSQPISLTTFVMGKALQRGALMLIVVLSLGLVGPIAAGATVTAAGGPLRVLLYACLLAAYTVFWLALAVLVNSWGKTSAANALTLVGLWLALLVVVPGLASVAVDAIYPSPSRVELVNLARAAASEAEAQTTELEGDHGKPAAADSGRRAVKMQAAFEQQVGPVLSRFREQNARQQAMVDKLRFISPAILLNEGLSDIAGGSVGRHQHFSAQTDAFHAELKQFFAERVERGAQLTAVDYDAMPQFVYQEPPDAELAGRVGASLLALVLAAAGLLALAAARLKRANALG
jgi:ABC-2 type transport system permease protein